MTEHERIAATLKPYADEPTVVRELHDVPPYRVYEVRLDGRRAVLKRDAHPRGHAADEGRVHEYVAQRTEAPVPDVIAVGDDHYVTAWSDTIAQTPETLDVNWARAAGAWLGALHDDTVGAFDGYGRPRDSGSGLELEGHSDWVDALMAKIDYHRAYLEEFGYADTADAVLQFLRTHPHALDGAGEPVLCHGDVHPEHVASVGETTAAIDFEHALVAPAEYDYWRTAIPYLEMRDDVDDAVRRAFRDGYEFVRSLPADLESQHPIYRAITGVAFLESVFLQRNVAPERRPAVADRLREAVSDALVDCRDASS
ncbi:phosphotransferase family protein [Halopiger aswanensis]|uniref:Phosphotransferase family enzyme n=1 Tax=Halopiger aswanensis TaxID=148449 RepID=A0A3R7GKT3_9EURY|nr:aminoglycoside phosphotransferase family protein [Halopiger aswanensis]RKD97560.1 phosphotransferase family enzyme [Halopiger aswanensis]